MEDDIEKNKELPMKWWKFLQYFNFPVGIILSLFSISNYSNINLNTLNIFGWIFFIGDIVMVILLCVTYINFVERKRKGYYLLLLYFISFTVWNTLISTLTNLTNGFRSLRGKDVNDIFVYTMMIFFISLAIAGGIWIYPNYIYFKKRKNLFCN